MIKTRKAQNIVNKKRKALVSAGMKEYGVPSVYTLFWNNPELMHKNIGRIRAGRHKPFGARIHKAMLLQLGSKNVVDKIYMDKISLGSRVEYDTIKIDSVQKYGDNLFKIEKSIRRQFIDTIHNEIHLNGFKDTDDVMKFNVFNWYRDAWHDITKQYGGKE
jgi:hypothetical protein